MIANLCDLVLLTVLSKDEFIDTVSFNMSELSMRSLEIRARARTQSF